LHFAHLFEVVVNDVQHVFLVQIVHLDEFLKAFFFYPLRDIIHRYKILLSLFRSFGSSGFAEALPFPRYFIWFAGFSGSRRCPPCF